MTPGDDINWNDLRYFLGATRSGTLSGAARALGVEHSTIGRRLSALERSLGVPLVHRGPDGLKLTLLGKQVVPLVEQIERSIAAINGIAASGQAHVKLATPSGFTALFSESLAQFSAEHPGISLEVVTGARPVDLSKGEADLAVRSGPVQGKDLIIRKVGESGFSLYASAAYIARRGVPADPYELMGHEIIAFEPGMATLPARWIERHAGDASVVLRSREMTEVLSAAASGLGLAVLPCLMGDEEPRLKRVTPQVLTAAQVSLVYRREVRNAPSVRIVISFVTSVLRRYAKRLYGA